LRVRVFKSRVFAQFCRKQRLADAALCGTLSRMLAGAIDANLGGGVFKQRIARPGQGKSGGFRTIVILRIGEIALFAYGFAKNERDNIDAADLSDFRLLAKEAFQYDEKTIAELISAGALE
jgi:hypothetical protein